MKTYRDLEIRGTSAELELVVQKIETLLSEGWSRDEAAEQRTTGDYYVFRCSATDQRPSASLWLRRGEENLSVANVTPATQGTLTADEYNTIIWEFYERFVHAAVEWVTGVQVRLGQAEETLTDWMSEQTAELLRSFTASATPSTGSSHPNDWERWHAFIIAAHREHAPVTTTQLRQWFEDEAGWGEDVVTTLIIEYEQGRALLGQYDLTT